VKKSVLVFVLFFVFILVQLVFISKSKNPLSIDEVETYLLAKTLTANNQGSANIIALEFAKINGYLLFPTTALYLTPFTFFPNTIYLARIPHLLAGFSLLIVVWILLQRFVAKNHEKNLLFILGPLIIIISPWLQSLILFHLPETLTLVLFITSVIIILKVKENTKDKILWLYLSITIILAALCSWQGLIIALVFPIITFLTLRKTSRRLHLTFTLILYFLLGVSIFKNINYIHTFVPERTFINQITPKRLAEDINERQKIDFLASNKQFILPIFIRKFIYNKPFLAYEKTLKHGVSFFDFEQFSFPLISYDIVKLSGLLPKGNLPLMYFWEIPLIMIGIFYVLTQKDNKLKLLILIIPLTLLPYLFFEKRNLPTTGIFSFPFLLIFETLGIYQIIKIIKLFSKKYLTLLAIFLTLIFISNIYEQYYLIYSDYSRYQTSDLQLYKEIAGYIKDTKVKYSKIIVTDRIGPTNLMTSFYLDLPPKDYWLAANNGQVISKINNMEFRPINIPTEDTSDSILFIGLPGEFTKPSKDPNNLPLPQNISLIDEIEAPDEIVYQYGKNIWVVTESKE
jgi:hypothetical protein